MEGNGEAEVRGYFTQLGERVCGWMDEAGYPFCVGNVMARNPRWCQSLQTWRNYFSDWVRRAEPQQLLEFSIFFDFRAVYGDPELAQELRRHVHTEVRQTPAFLPHLAQNALLFRPPPRLFGRLIGAGEQAGTLNLKDAALPIVSFARLYALKQELSDTHTLDRLRALAEHGALLEVSREQTAAAYDLLARLRLQHHTADLGRPPDNIISRRKLTAAEEALLQQAFAQTVAIQRRISQDFLGGT